MSAKLHAVLLLLLAAILSHAQVGPVRINEVLAVNRTSLTNAGSTPDYVELYNTNVVDVHIGGWRLTDDVTRPSKFVFRTGTMIPARSHLIVYCDLNTNAAGIHTGFALDSAGEALYLIRPTLVLADRVIFGFQCPDRSIGRYPDFTGPFQLGIPSPGATNNNDVTFGDLANLRVNEWMALRGEPGDEEDNPDWFELYNIDSRIVSIAGLVFTDQNHSPATNRPLPDLSFIAPKGFIRFFADDGKLPDHLDFKLSSTSGDMIVLLESNRTAQITRVQFPPQTRDVSQGYLPDGDTNNIVYFPTDRATPGESNYLPIENVRINEVLANSDAPRSDAIELYNPSESFVDIGGWYLSDSREELQKFRIRPGVILAPFGFEVFYELAGSPDGFNANGLGISPSFTLSSTRGGEVILSSVDRQGRLTGYRRMVDFGPSLKGVSFGRYITSTGEPDFVPMSRVTLGAHNSGPRIAPIVITEIMYHPRDIVSGTMLIDNTMDEYIELYNHSAGEVRLFDPNASTNTWRIEGDADFQFPTNVVILPGESVLVVSFNPTANMLQQNAFRVRFRVPPTTRIFGPWLGDLANGDGNVDLYAPGLPDEGIVPYVAMEKVKYFDNDYRSYWPLEADGYGFSLARQIPEEYANDIANWRAEPPSPGSQRIELEPIYTFGNTVAIRFLGWAGSSYSVLRSTNLQNWTRLADVPIQPTSGPRHVVDPGPRLTTFYQVVTPAEP